VVHRARVQRDAVAAIKRVGGLVGYNWRSAKPPGPDWVRRTLGPDFLDTATHVWLQGEQCDDESLRAACRLPWLEELIVVNTSVTDAAVEDIRHLTNLRSLDLRLNRITPRPLPHIAELSELRELKLAMRLSPVPLRDEDMVFLKRMTKLESLVLPSANLTDAWLVYIEDLRKLKSLQLYDMALTAEGLDRLKGLTNLTAHLTLQGTRIPLRMPNATDGGIVDAKRHPLIRLNSRKGILGVQPVKHQG
jgi:hypothetical protein